MRQFNRRNFLATAALAAPALLLHPGARAAAKGTFRIGYQKASVTLVLARP